MYNVQCPFNQLRRAGTATLYGIFNLFFIKFQINSIYNVGDTRIFVDRYKPKRFNHFVSLVLQDTQNHHEILKIIVWP